MKKLLLKKLFIGVALFAASFSFAQAGQPVVLTYGPPVTSEIDVDGFLSDSFVFTVSNIPNGTTNTILVRSYEDGIEGGSGSNTGILNDAELTLNSADPDVDNNKFAVVTQADTPAVGYITRTFTIKRIAGTYVVGTTYRPSVRMLEADGGGSNPFPDDYTGTDVSSGKHLITSVGTDHAWVGVATLGDSDFENISKSIYPNPVSNRLNISRDLETRTYRIVSLLGNTIKEEKASGSIDVSDLSSGIYLLVTDTGIAKFVKK